MEQCSSFSLPEISMNELALSLIESLPSVPPILLWSPLLGVMIEFRVRIPAKAALENAFAALPPRPLTP